MSEHTPGPWFIAEEPDIEGLTIIETGRLEDYPVSRCETRNANLIAAAPDLLGALEEAEEFIDRHSEDWYISGQELLAKTRKAIAKAKGGVMSDKPENPPAFPVPHPGRTTGMSLRDYFANQVLAGLISAAGDSDGVVDYDEEIVANSAYKMADAMLKARES